MRFRINIFILSALFLWVSCSTVPITGRRQLNMIPNESILSMSDEQYNNFLTEHEISSSNRQREEVQEVGERISHAVEQYLTDNGYAQDLNQYDWEFNLVESEEKNAWCMPGGKVVFYTGILSITENENGLAVVMAHEIAHAVAKHGNERMSQGLLVQMGGMALTKALETRPAETQDLWLQAFGITSNLGLLLPYSRLHEKEADHLGMVFMAMAGYHPQHALDFWTRMAELNDTPNPPEMLSTHPSDEVRIKQIQELMPEAMAVYEAKSQGKP